MASILIELDGKGGTVSIDGGEPAPFQDIREVVEVLMSIGGAPDAEEAQAFDAAATPEAPTGPMGQRGM